MRDKFMAFALCIVGSMTPFCGAGVGGEGAEVERLARGNAAFAVDFYHELRASEGNIFFSPLSVSSALAMTYAGARENTAKEMKKALHFTLGPAQLHSTFKSLCRELKTNAREGGHKLNIANGLCLTGGDVSGNFKTLLTDNYDAEVFSGGLERINAWVKEKTEGKIQKILEGLSDDSVCVILNAIYFKGDWESRFDKQRTFEAPFKVSRLKEVTVPMMYQQGDFRVVEREDFQAVAIPYVRGERPAKMVEPIGRESRSRVRTVPPETPDGNRIRSGAGLRGARNERRFRERKGRLSWHGLAERKPVDRADQAQGLCRGQRGGHGSGGRDRYGNGWNAALPGFSRRPPLPVPGSGRRDRQHSLYGESIGSHEGQRIELKAIAHFTPCSVTPALPEPE